MRIAICAAACASLATAAFGQTALKTVRVVDGLTRPVQAVHAPGDPSRLFIVEQMVNDVGRVVVFDLIGNALLAQPFLEVPWITTEVEQGLLGLAFHPQYQSNGYLYVHYTTQGAGPGGRVVVARYKVSADPARADPASAQMVIGVEHDQADHNGGWLGFGPDGYLYVAIGDGGGGDDPADNAQTITGNLQGKLLRLDVDGDDFPADPERNYSIPPTNPFAGAPGDDEIWAYGLRNPSRCSFDRLTGDLWIGDVGQGTWEEINVQNAGAAGGQNYGWRCMEGPECRAFDGCDCRHPIGVPPAYAYDRSEGRCVTGGYVYRGCAIPDLRGTYFFADFEEFILWSLRYDGQVTDLTNRTAELHPGAGLDIIGISSFGEDLDGELYIVDYFDGEVFKIVPEDGTGACCVADFNGDGFVDGIDYDTFNNAFESGDPSADINGDTFVDGIDYDTFNNGFEGGC